MSNKSDVKEPFEQLTFDLDEKNEALQLVGLERVQQFSPEEYRQARKKLVSIDATCVATVLADRPSTGPAYTSIMFGHLWFAVPVRSLVFLC